MPIPHTFPSLLNPDALKSVLLIGAGMSYGMAPPVSELTNEIRQKHNEIIQQLGIDIQPPAGDQFYDWAEEAFNELKNVHHLSDREAKLRLADAMGITSDPRFQAKFGMPLRGNTPRHRVVARFAREGRWGMICSLNWDCILETALESVGLLPHPDPQNHHTNPLPWQRWYCTWQPGDQHSPTAIQDCTVHLIKPHGCVNKLAARDASSFIVTRSEITDLPNQLGTTVAGRMKVGFSDAPFVTVGWSASEDYIHDNIQAIKDQGTLTNVVDRLSIIDPFWQPLPPSVECIKHNRLAATYSTDQNGCYFSTENAGKPTTDEFFKWLQTCYGLGILHQYVRAPAQINAWQNEATILEQVQSDFSEPRCNHWLNNLFDDFLHVWVRMCFNSKCVIYLKQGLVGQEQVATHRRDEHIPWGYVQTYRYDLLAIIPLILALWRNQNCPWNFSEFPGALWDGSEGHLVLPLPAWGAQCQPIELAALKPLMDGWNWSNKGAIKKFSILPLMPEPSFAPPPDNDVILRSSVAWRTKASQFADPTKIGVVVLSDL